MEISRTERHILKEMGFVCHVEHPHKFISNYLATLETPPELTQEAWNLANDRYFYKIWLIMIFYVYFYMFYGCFYMFASFLDFLYSCSWITCMFFSIWLDLANEMSFLCSTQRTTFRVRIRNFVFQVFPVNFDSVNFL